ncbi:hypothetical protein NUH88_15385 [Nisaea acidiphila]|uniref:Uncharacterized protein n=1 Tax=Nisaea acidiphila TaxID=1862145 RepID=A0A9J7ANL2_9PROT|nr:hypothetical protein [Nisaea acidiphila]UUX48783.1 hypothetical protein NUH88_15385 [Nisaea acidiphila]
MLLVTAVDGPATADTGSVARYEATAFNQPNPTPADLAKINWEVRVDGVRVMRAIEKGPLLEVPVKAEYAGRDLLVMPFANSPTERVSKTTRVAGEQQRIDAPAEVALRIDGQRHYARLNDGAEFYVGSDVSYGQRRGLMNTTPGTDLYAPENYHEQFGFWADVITPTAMCESKGSFHCLNTYDRAAFTFGFYQEAAHVAGENFILQLRRFLLLPEARFYFPDLTLSGGHVAQKTADGITILEDSNSSQGLMDYLNPDPDAVGEQEAKVAAKFVHWAENSEDNRANQVAFAVEQQRQKFFSYAGEYDLDGAEDSVCIVIADIRHQGRAKNTVIQPAVRADDPLNALLEIGADKYPERIKTLRSEIERMTEEGILGHHSYSLVNRDFVLD